MGSAFGEITGFVAQNGVTPKSKSMSVYLGMDPTVLRFRGAVAVLPEVEARADGNICSDSMPAGDAISTTPVGRYESLNQAHQAMWRYVKENAICGGFPIWEIYLDDPAHVPPSTLRTEIYWMIG
jgi:effector-binding domain-containing protein